MQDAQLKLQSAEASLANLRVQMQNDLLQQRATAASVEADYNKAKMQAEMNEALAKQQLVSELVLRQSQLDAEHAGHAPRHRAASSSRRAPNPAARRSPSSNRASIRRAPSCS